MTEMNSPASNGNPQPPPTPTAPDNAAAPTITPKPRHFSTLAQTGSGNRHQAKSSENKIACWFDIKLRTICEFAVVMPLGGMVICLITALMFQFEHIQETACKTGYNVVPSISAVTGISPGRYLWRIVIAFHLGPRILIAAVYHNFLKSFEKALDPDSASVLKKMLKGCYYLQICEIIGLCGISFIHNREHYPTHEKGFILYLSSSHMSFLLILKIYHLIWPFLNTEQRWSYYKKLFIFVFSITCLALMAYFYYRHIIHCDSMAFSIFAFVEYFVAAANMGYYWTLVSDLPNEEIIVRQPLTLSATVANGQSCSTPLMENSAIINDTNNGHHTITEKKDL